MNKAQQFWLDLWRNGSLPFHKDEVNNDLIAFWPSLNIPAKEKILVPLCGKSLDMIWLLSQGYQVIGIELSEQAIVQFLEEHQLSYQYEVIGNSRRYDTDSLTLWVADIFTLDPSFIPTVAALYDRAALIALPANLRAQYVAICLGWLRKKGRVLLKTMCYNAPQTQGPPFSVSDAEVALLYADCDEMECLKDQVRVLGSEDHLSVRGLNQVNDKVWTMTKK